MSSIENIDNLTPEELISPPKYDAMSVLMAMITSLIVGVIVGVIILLFSFLALGKFSLESGVSPILLAMITFFALVIGNLIYYTILSKIFPNIYSRGRTALAQIVILSILLYLFFAPVYIVISTFSKDSSFVLWAFSAHILLSIFAFHIVIALISQYRYSLLSIYTSIASLLFTTMVVLSILIFLPSSMSSLFVLFGLSIVAYFTFTFLYTLLCWLYYTLYVATGSDIVGNIFARIESEEKNIEREAMLKLTSFHK